MLNIAGMDLIQFRVLDGFLIAPVNGPLPEVVARIGGQVGLTGQGKDKKPKPQTGNTMDTI